MSEYWLKTQHMLQGQEPLVRRPLLTDALLKRPPFRFLQDVVDEVIRNTGFSAGSHEELLGAGGAYLERDGKLRYLKAVFQAVKLATGKAVPASPAKVIAGLEPENTNTFLQLLAEAGQLALQQNLQAQLTPSPAPVEPVIVERVPGNEAASLAASQDQASATISHESADSSRSHSEGATSGTRHEGYQASGIDGDASPGSSPGTGAVPDAPTRAAHKLSVRIISRRGPPRATSMLCSNELAPPVLSASQSGGDLTASTEPSASAGDLRSIIGELCKIAPALAESMKRWQHDLPAVQNELSHWQQQRKANEAAWSSSSAPPEKQMASLDVRAQLDAQIVSSAQQIGHIKSRLNDTMQIIGRLLDMVAAGQPLLQPV